MASRERLQSLFHILRKCSHPRGPGKRSATGSRPQHKHIGKEFPSTSTLSLASLSLACIQQATDDYLELGCCVKTAPLPPHPPIKKHLDVLCRAAPVTSSAPDFRCVHADDLKPSICVRGALVRTEEEAGEEVLWMPRSEAVGYLLKD